MALRNIKLLHSVCWNPVQFFTKKLRVIFIALFLLISFGADLNAQTITSAASGDWNNPFTWVGSTIPASTDDVIIAAGHTVNVNISPANCKNITINNTGTLNFTLGGANLNVYGNWTNNGTLIAGTGRVLFFGTGSATISGSSPSAFYNLTINKGTDITSVVEANGAGAISNSNNITITNGLFKMTTGTFQFIAPAPTIPPSGGVWLNGATLNVVGTSLTNNGLTKISSGTANIGSISGNELTTRTGGTLQIEGGTVNITGRLVNTEGTALITGGTINLSTIGHSSSTLGSFHMSLSTDLTISGNPLIIFHNPNSAAAGDILISNSTGTKTITGGTFQMGGSSPPSSSIFVVNTSIPLYNFTINSVGTPSVRLVSNDLTVNNTLTLNGGNLDALTNGKKVIVANNATTAIVRTAGHVIGDLQRAIAGSGSLSYSFPIGTTANYTPAVISFTGLTAAGNLTGSSTNGDHPSLNTSSLNSSASVNNYWTFTNSGVAFSSYAATFSYPSTLVDVSANPANFRVGRYNASTWTYPSISGTPSNTSTSITGVTSFGQFAIAECSAQIFTVTGGGNFCTGGTGVPVGLNGSETGFSYQLYVDGSPTGSPVPGTGSSIDFGNQTTAGTYTVIATNTTTLCTAAMNGSVVVISNSPPAAFTITYTGSNPICEGQGIVINLTDSESGVKYELFNMGNNQYFSHPSITGTGGAISFTPIFLTPGIYTIAVDGTITLPPPPSSPTSCITRMLNTVTVEVLYTPAKPVITPLSSTTFCAGGSVIFNAVSIDSTFPTASGSFQWNKDGLAISGATNTSYTATTGGVYTVTFTIPNGCSSTSLPQTVTVNPLPTVTCPGNSSVCISAAPFPLTGATPSGGTYSGPGVSGGNFDPADAGAGTHTITYSYTDPATGCSASCTFTITVSNLPNAGITGTASICAGQSSLLDANATPGSGTISSYQWKLDGLSIAGATSATYNANTAGNYTVTVVNSSGCSFTSPVFTLTVNPVPPTPTITTGGPTTFCAGGSVTLSSSSASGNQWYKDAVLIAGETNNTYTANASGDYTVIVSALGCSSPASAATTVTVNPVPATPTISASGPTSFCAGGTVTLTSSSASGNQWYKDAVLIPGATNNTYIANASGDYTVIVTKLGCSSPASAATTVTVNPVPATPTISASGPTSFCAGGTVTLTSSSASGNQWYKDAVLIPGATNNTYIANASGDYTVIVTKLGCSSPASAATTVTVNPVPATPTISASGPTSFCAGGTVTLTSSSASNNQWYKDAVLIVGEINQSIIVSTSGSYTVTVTGANGCLTTSAATDVNAYPYPTATIIAGGSTTFCAGGSVTLTASDGTSWLWSNGATTKAITVNLAGFYSVTATNGTNCSTTSAATEVIVTPAPIVKCATCGPAEFEAGSYIIDMGVMPQTINNGLAPYGLLYELVNIAKIPVYWSVKKDKSFVNQNAKQDQVDVIVNSKSYKGGPFIISAKDTALAGPIIRTWKANYPATGGIPGLTVDQIPVQFTAPDYAVLTYLPKVVLDAQTGNLIQAAFYTKAGIPSSAYTLGGIPSLITQCDDIYVLPHADPLAVPGKAGWPQLQKDSLYNFVNGGGWLFSSCHAVSAIEACFASNGTRLNFLSSTGLLTWKDSTTGNDNHSDPTAPFSYRIGSGNEFNNLASDPYMQFIGTLDGAMLNGSEQVYLPLTTWRPSTTVAVYDSNYINTRPNPDVVYPNTAALVAYGHAYGDVNKGFVEYVAGHRFDGSGSVAEQVAATRVYANFWLRAGLSSRPQITPISTPTTANAGDVITFDISVTSNSSSLTYSWTSTCGGIFSSPNSATTDFTVPSVNGLTNCTINLIVTDNCGRSDYYCVILTITPTLYNNVISSSQTICSGQTAANLTGTLPSGGDGNYTYLWESSTTGPLSGFTPAAGINNLQDYIIPGLLSQTTWFIRSVTGIIDGVSTTVISQSIQINVKPTPAASASASPTSICPGGSSTLSATAPAFVINTITLGTAPNVNFKFNDPKSSTITISGAPVSMASILSISVKVNVTHRKDQEVELYLIRPGGSLLNVANGNYLNTIVAGESIALVADRGADGDNFTNTIFTDAAAQSISAGTAPFTGSFRPENAFSTLTGNPNGDWILKAMDDTNNEDGTLKDWTITITFSNGISYSWSSNPAGFSSTLLNPGTVSPAVTTVYTISVTDALNGCVGTASATVTVGTPVITTQPTAKTICEGSNTSFTVTATGTSLSYEWQISADGVSGWTSLSDGVTYNGVTTNTLTISNAPLSLNGYYYRVAVRAGTCTPVYSNAVLLTVNPLPTITPGTAGSVCFNTAAQTTTLPYSATNTPTTYSIVWTGTAPTFGFIDVTDAPLLGSPITISVPANAPVGTYTGTITVKNANGCVSTTKTFTITINAKPSTPAITHN